MKRFGALMLALVTVMLAIPLAASAGADDNMNARTRAFTRQLNGCAAMVGLAIQIVQQHPTDRLGASDAINQTKSTCQTIRDRMATMNTNHFYNQALDGEIAVDYYARGLGRFSNYIDDGHPSDVSKAVEYFKAAKRSQAACLRGINQRRAVYGLGPLSS